MTDEDGVSQLRALNTHFREQWAPNGYPVLEWAATEIERLRSLVRELRPFLELDIECALEMGPPEDSCVGEVCDDCAWYNRAVIWKQRLEAGDLHV